MIEDFDCQAAIGAIHEAASECGVEIFVVGRLARDLRLKDHLARGELEETNDIDFALMVRDWPAYQRLRNTLLNRPSNEFIEDAHQKQRLIFRQSLPVDLVPAGQVAGAQGIIHWPPDGSPEMNVQGFEDAFEGAGLIDLGFVRVRVASLPGIVLLKLLAWNDHRDERIKDIQDFASILKHFERCTGEERLYSGPDGDLIEVDDFDFSLAWARILGRDVGRMIRLEATKRWLMAFLHRETNEPHELAWRLQRYLLIDFEKSLAVVSSFCGGVRDILAASHEAG